MASEITSLTVVYSPVHSGIGQGKHKSSVSLVFVRGIQRSPVNSLHKWPVTRKMIPFDDVIILYVILKFSLYFNLIAISYLTVILVQMLLVIYSHSIQIVINSYQFITSTRNGQLHWLISYVWHLCHHHGTLFFTTHDEDFILPCFSWVISIDPCRIPVIYSPIWARVLLWHLGNHGVNISTNSGRDKKIAISQPKMSYSLLVWFVFLFDRLCNLFPRAQLITAPH